jgi:hypothetical protein
MGSGELLQNFRTMICQFDINLASVLDALLAGNQILFHRSINQAYCTVVSDMQLFSQLADRDAFAVRKTLNGKQGLMLARGESGVLGGLFAEMQKLAQLIAKCRKHLVLGFADPSGRASFRTGLHKEFDQEPAQSLAM